jgi:hypothetical protein
MRRQIRALLGNERARLSGVYFRFSVDPELNAWIVPGGGELKYGRGGISLGDFQLELRDTFVVGTKQTHRPALHLRATDLRLSTSPRDYRGTKFSTVFADQPARVFAGFPVGAADLVIDGLPAGAQTFSVVGQGGSTPVIYEGEWAGVNVDPGSVVSYTLADEDHGKNDVVVLDRRGFTAPSYSLANEADPQESYGWEEVYGEQYPLTGTDAPVLQNGHVRVEWVAAQNALRLLRWSTSSGYDEVGRFTFWVGATQATGLFEPSVEEWTTERAVISFALAGANAKVRVYVTIQRGWRGVHTDVYAYNAAAQALPAIRWSPFETGGFFAATNAGASNTVGATLAQPSATGFQNWHWVAPFGDDFGIAFGYLWGYDAGNGVQAVSVADTAAYGSSRNAFEVETVGTNYTWVGGRWSLVDLVVSGSTRLGTAEAETWRNTGSGTTAQAADGAASGGLTVTDTQSGATNNTVQVAGASANSLPRGRYLLYARVAAINGGATVSVSATFGAASLGSPVSLASTTYAWLRVGEANLAAAGDAIGIKIWRSGGTGNTKIDAFALVPVELDLDADEGHHGAREQANAALMDTRPVHVLVAR